MTIREVIEILMDAPDKDKPFIIECHKNTFADLKTEWGQGEVERIINCGWGSVAEIKKPELIAESEVGK